MTRFITLAEYLWLAEQVTGDNAATLARAARIDLADSALHAPQASFGNAEFYPDPYDKAAVLLCRLTWNHPLIDGNKRAAWAALVSRGFHQEAWRLHSQRAENSSAWR